MSDFLFLNYSRLLKNIKAIVRRIKGEGGEKVL